MSVNVLRLISPVDGMVYDERPAASRGDLDVLLRKAREAQMLWRSTPVDVRVAQLSAAVRALTSDEPRAATELAWQMGRPVRYGPSELARTAERASHMLAIAPSSLQDEVLDQDRNHRRLIRRDPVGVVLVVAPWNYPYLTAVNSVVPALAAGNSVVLKHSPQTLLVADRFARAFADAGLPEGVFQVLQCTNEMTLTAIRHPAVDHVVFTGSVAVGRIVAAAAAEGLKTVTLELGGKDPAYVRADADVTFAAQQLADGAFFNSGQSCCGIERIYVHKDRYRDLVDILVDEAKRLQLGNPLDPSTTLGPMARDSGAEVVRQHIRQAVTRGAEALIDPAEHGDGGDGSCYVAPQVLVGVDHGMEVMREETFGPVVGIMPVADDNEATALMNDSTFGLTASIWSSDPSVCDALSQQLNFGTIFANRCDYLDPSLPWSGRKNSGIGLSLSRLAYASLTRPQSVLFERLHSG